MMRCAVVALLIWLAVGAAGAQSPAVQAPPMPALTGRVVDTASLLDAADQATLTATLAALEAKTTDQLVVVTLPALNGVPIEDFGYQLGRRWGIGQKGTSSGALLIVAAAEHRVRIEVGYGLEGTLTDAATRTIIETDILPRFKAGDVPGGIKAGVADIAALLGAQPAAASLAPTPQLAGARPTWPGIALGVGFVLLLVFCGITGGALCQGLMQLLFVFSMFGRGGGRSGDPQGGGFSGGGGSFGGGGSSGSW